MKGEIITCVCLRALQAEYACLVSNRQAAEVGFNMKKQNSPEEEKYRLYSRYASSRPYRDLGALKGRHVLRNILITLLLIVAAVFCYAERAEFAALLSGERTDFGKIFRDFPVTFLSSLQSGTVHPGQELTDGTEAETEDGTETETETEAPETEVPFSPHAVESTMPSNLIESTGIEVNGTVLDDPASYVSDADIQFGMPEDYTDVDGIVTFRGNNFRDEAAYGYANIKDQTIEGLWTQQTGGLTVGNATWTGSGWTGQPLLRRWSRSQKKNMAMFDWAKDKDDLVEVIYACMDGYVYFLDMETGEKTRDPLYLGWTFKGAGALDPRGYPILYVGAGYDSNAGTAHAFIVNLVDMSTMYEFGALDEFSLRGNLSYFDSSPLVDAETDTLIWPGENGILYLIHLNTAYNDTTGQVAIDPDKVVKWHYTGTRTSVQQYWLGMEDSCDIYKGYIFMADNGGNLMCMDLRTLKLVWVQDTLDDTNDTPVLSAEDGHLYLYISTSFHLGWRSSTTASIPIWKIDAETGEIIWKKEYECYTQDGVSGGVQSTIAVGKNSLDDKIYVTVAMTGTPSGGVLACLDKKTGEVQWEHKAFYAWSSPVCVYNEDGSGYVIYASCGGRLYLLDGQTGAQFTQFELSQGAIEASPAVYNDYVIIGTRASQIWGLKLR